MTKTPFSKEKALKSAIVSNQIEGYASIKDKVKLKKVKKYLSLIYLSSNIIFMNFWFNIWSSTAKIVNLSVLSKIFIIIYSLYF